MALSLNPNFAPALNARGVVHIYTGQPEMAVPYIERAMRLDPAVDLQLIDFSGFRSTFRAHQNVKNQPLTSTSSQVDVAVSANVTALQ